MEELVLCSFFAGKEVDIVEDENVCAAAVIAERAEARIAERADKLTGEGLRGEIGDLQPRLFEEMIKCSQTVED